jgi:hypothetical protein
MRGLVVYNAAWLGHSPTFRSNIVSIFKVE